MILFSNWSSHANHVPHFCLSRDSHPSRFVKLSLPLCVCFLFFIVCFTFNAQKVEVVIEKQIHIHLNFIDPKIKIFRNFQDFVLSPIPIPKNSEIMEILQKRHDTKIWECSFKNSWNAVKITSNSKLYSLIANHVAGICGTFKSFWPSRSKIN